MIGLCHFSIGDHDSALEYFSESVHRRIFSHGINHPIVHQAKIDVAHVLTSKERVDDALELFSEIRSECHLISDNSLPNSVISNLNLAEIHRSQGEIYLTQKKDELAFEELSSTATILNTYLIDFKDHSDETYDSVLQKLAETYESLIVTLESRNIETKEKIEFYNKICHI